MQYLSPFIKAASCFVLIGISTGCTEQRDRMQAQSLSSHEPGAAQLREPKPNERTVGEPDDETPHVHDWRNPGDEKLVRFQVHGFGVAPRTYKLFECGALEVLDAELGTVRRRGTAQVPQGKVEQVFEIAKTAAEEGVEPYRESDNYDGPVYALYLSGHETGFGGSEHRVRKHMLRLRDSLEQLAKSVPLDENTEFYVLAHPIPDWQLQGLKKSTNPKRPKDYPISKFSQEQRSEILKAAENPYDYVWIPSAVWYEIEARDSRHFFVVLDDATWVDILLVNPAKE